MGQLIAFGIYAVVWIADSFFLRTADALGVHISWYVRIPVAIVVLMASVLLIKSGHAATEHSGASSGLITTGAFRYVRHPLYLGSMLFYLAVAVSTASALAVVLLIPIFVLYNYIAGYEEKLLEAKYGTEHIRYKQAVGKWVPKL